MSDDEQHVDTSRKKQEQSRWLRVLSVILVIFMSIIVSLHVINYLLEHNGIFVDRSLDRHQQCPDGYLKGTLSIDEHNVSMYFYDSIASLVSDQRHVVIKHAIANFQNTSTRVTFRSPIVMDDHIRKYGNDVQKDTERFSGESILVCGEEARLLSQQEIMDIFLFGTFLLVEIGAPITILIILRAMLPHLYTDAETVVGVIYFILMIGLGCAISTMYPIMTGQTWIG